MTFCTFSLPAIFALALAAQISSTVAKVEPSTPEQCLSPSSRAATLVTQDKTSAPSALTSDTTLKSEGQELPSPTVPEASSLPPQPHPPGMVWIPAGEFDMGGIGPEARPDEFPVHRVQVDGFWMDATEVSNAEFRRFVGETGYVTTAEKNPDWEELKKQLPPGTPKPDDSILVPGSLVFSPPGHRVPLNNHSLWWQWVKGADWTHPVGPHSRLSSMHDNLPVVHVSWDDAVAYCKWAGKRLPTEAEWEYASLGGNPARRFTWGDTPPSDSFLPANLWQGDFPHHPQALDGYVLSAPVDSDTPSPYGLHHMIGNVWEWCSDWYREDTYKHDADSAKTTLNPKGPADSFDPMEPTVPKRINRGGSFLCDASYCASYRPAARMKTSPDSSSIHTGFRAVISDPHWRLLVEKKH
jgi:formylglycine-generating enzyme